MPRLKKKAKKNTLGALRSPFRGGGGKRDPPGPEASPGPQGPGSAEVSATRSRPGPGSLGGFGGILAPAGGGPGADFPGQSWWILLARGPSWRGSARDHVVPPCPAPRWNRRPLPPPCASDGSVIPRGVRGGGGGSPGGGSRGLSSSGGGESRWRGKAFPRRSTPGLGGIPGAKGFLGPPNRVSSPPHPPFRGPANLMWVPKPLPPLPKKKQSCSNPRGSSWI